MIRVEFLGMTEIGHRLIHLHQLQVRQGTILEDFGVLRVQASRHVEVGKRFLGLPGVEEATRPPMVRLGALRVQRDGLRERSLSLVPLLLVGVQLAQRQGSFQCAGCRLFSFIGFRDDPWVAGPLRCRSGHLEDDETHNCGDQQQPGSTDDQASRWRR